jgi:hypothetical protein
MGVFFLIVAFYFCKVKEEFHCFILIFIVFMETTKNAQSIQVTLFQKLANLTNPTYAVLKKMVQDKKSSESARLSKEELLIAKEYLKDIQSSSNAVATKWNPDARLEQLGSFFTLALIDRLLKLFDQQEKTGASLIPIKGISKIMQAKLRTLGIYDIPGLLVKGKTQVRRNSIAARLDINVKLVNSWVKQADLWRVDGMTPDVAYLFVQIGVRHTEDLSKVDVDKAYPIMERLVLAQPDFHLPDNKALLSDLIKKAEEHTKYAISNNLSLSIEVDEEEPTFLFRDDIAGGEEPKSSGEIIEEGLGFLKDVVLALPLPHTIMGKVSIDPVNSSKLKAYPNALIEISGISSPSADKADKEKNPSAYTDSQGKFAVVMPDKYTLQEVITITISQGGWKQKFIKGASDIMNAVTEQETLNKFDELGDIVKFIKIEKQKQERLHWLKVELGDNASSYTSFKLNEMESERRILEAQDIEKKIESLWNDHDKITEDILRGDKQGSSLEQIMNNLLSNNNLKADLGDFTLVEEIFKNINVDKERALPSVKLMGNDDQTVHLPTDTAPSRVFNYGMLQRLVEPTMEPKGKTRKALTSPIDVMDFKSQLYTNPDNYPKMASLGIGYILNMHQAWVPDGFALGTLLYSLVLAPGEEQRLIVREKTQAYTVSDDAEGTDAVSENYELSQTDDTTATYNYAVDQLSKANSDYSYSTKTSGFGGGYSGAANVSYGMFNLGSAHGLSGGYSKSSGSGSASAKQSNAHNEASSAAQSFQHSIKSASDRVSQSKRISMRTATSEEKEAVATKIIANHNHSHAMTIQYWEVMRRYRLETCVDGVELVLFVPLKLIRFLPQGQNYLQENLSDFTKSLFNNRYKTLLQYADILLSALPYKYRSGLNLIKKYASYPKWNLAKPDGGMKELILEFNGNLLDLDDITASLILKNGKGTIAGDIIESGTRKKLKTSCRTKIELKQEIRKKRDESPTLVFKCTFMVPSGITNDDLSFIKIAHSCEGLEYPLHLEWANDEQKENAKKLKDKEWDLAKDTKDSANDRTKIEYYKKQMPEAYLTPMVTLSSPEIMNEGAPVISINKLTLNGASMEMMLSSTLLRSSVTISIINDTPVLRYSELQEMEALMQHVAADTLHYSQIVWGSLGVDERAMMLEQYTIDMNFDKLTAVDDEEIKPDSNKKKNRINIPLLNCVNVKKLMGFYGNCILLPFTYPKELADKLGKTAAELQDALYRYHTTCFRVPTTTISLPTDGMIGEAVLGETNVSELIDLTRFWNWKDSPIDKMNIDNTYLNDTDYLADKTTSEITALNLQGATPATPVTVNDLITALVNKQTPTFENITALEQLKDILNEGTKSASEGRNKVLDTTVELAKQSVEILKNSKINTTSKPNSNNASSNNDDKITAIIKKAIDAKNDQEVEALKSECKEIPATEEKVIKLAKAYCEKNGKKYEDVEARIKIISTSFKKEESK